MTEYRCKFCHKLLFKYDKQKEVMIFDKVNLDKCVVEIKCPKCHNLNEVSLEFFETGEMVRDNRLVGVFPNSED